MEELEKILGLELYQKVMDRLSGKKLILDDGKLIPKHRFDCVNLCLNGTKQELKEKICLAECAQKSKINLEKLLLDSKIETALALHMAKNSTAVKALIDFTNLKLEQDGSVPGLEEQILQIKENQNYLFESQESLTYVLVPVKNNDLLNKSITNYINKMEKKNERITKCRNSVK